VAAEQFLTGLTAEAEARRRRNLIDYLRALRDRETILAYRRAFTDEAGLVTPAGTAMIADLMAVTRTGEIDNAKLSNDELRYLAGMRAVLIHIMQRLDLNGAKLRHLASRLKENRSE
jgi:hypothetical protein